MSPSPTLAAPAVSQRLTSIIEPLCRAAAARAGRRWAIAPLVLLLWPYLRRLAARFDALAARLRIGRPRKPPAPRTVVRTSRPSVGRLPQGYGWLLRVVPEAGGFGSQLRHLLADPEMAALLEASPQAGRILRPLCRMLGIGPSPDVPAALFPSRPDRPSPDRPSPDRPSPDRPSPDRPSPDRPSPDRPSPDGPSPDRPRRLVSLASSPTARSAALPDAPEVSAGLTTDGLATGGLATDGPAAAPIGPPPESA